MSDVVACQGCGMPLGASELACPSCQKLVHADKLKELASEAERATLAQDPSAAMSAWRSALELLPRGSKQHEAIASKIEELQKAAPKQAPEPPSWTKRAGPLGVVAMLIWKFKFALAFVLTKGKLLLLGLTKASTFFSMLLFFGVYWKAFGWSFAAGLVLLIYVHEMGHVAALRRFGLRASAPMFIPGFGALVRLKQYPANPIEESRVGLAGPLWGLGATGVALLLAIAFESPTLGAIAHLGAWMNLFNLIPVWQLDGARGFVSLTTKDRWILIAVIGVVWFLSQEGLLLVILIAGAVRAFGKNAPERRDAIGLAQFVFLIAALSALESYSASIVAQGSAAIAP